MYWPINLERVNSSVVWRNQRSRQKHRSKSTCVSMVDRHTCTRWVKPLTRIHTRQTDRSRSGMEADEQNSMTYIRGCTMRPPGTKGIRGDGQVPRDSPYRFKINTAYLDDVSTQRDTKPSPGHPYNCFLYRSQLNAAKTDRFLHRSHSCLWKLCPFEDVAQLRLAIASLPIEYLEVSPDTVGELSRRYSTFSHMPWILGLYFSGSLINFWDGWF